MRCVQAAARIFKAAPKRRLAPLNRRQRDQSLADPPAKLSDQPRLQQIKLVVAIHNQQIDIRRDRGLVRQHIERPPAFPCSSVSHRAHRASVVNSGASVVN